MKTSIRFPTRLPARPALLALLVLLLVPLSVQAQGGQRGGMGAGAGGMMGAGMLEQLLLSPAGLALEHRAELELSAEQVTRLQAMNTAFEEEHEAHLTLLRERAEQLAAMREQGRQGGMQQGQGMRQGGAMQGQGGALAEMQPAMQALREARQGQLQAMGDFLTANQLRQLREKMGPMGPGGPGSTAWNRVDGPRGGILASRGGMRLGAPILLVARPLQLRRGAPLRGLRLGR